jgi:heptaprenyl diphosphate synthase
MQSVNKSKLSSSLETRQQIARLAALTLVFTYAELLIPRVIPFFRIGLGNAALLMGLGLSFPAFMLLSVIKSVAGSLMGGTLFSPFFLVSFAQSVASALVMFVFGKMARVSTMQRDGFDIHRKLLSLYGISVAGSAVSAAVQISLSSLYLGQGTWSLLGPMLLFNAVSGLITAWLAEILGGGSPLEPQHIHAEGEYPLARTSLLATPSAGTPLRCLRSKLGYNAPDTAGSHDDLRPRNIFRLIIILAAAASVFFIKNTAILCGFLLLSFLAQKLAHRKILLLPHLSLWLFVLVTSVLIPNGRVLFSVAGFSITAGALFTGLQKALRLSIVSALSQTAATIKLTGSPDSLLALTLDYYSAMSDTFRNTPGSVISKIKEALK